MRVLLLSSGFFPASTGGGEVQVLLLARALKARGDVPVILAFDSEAPAITVRTDFFEGLRVERLSCPVELSWYARPKVLVDWARQWLTLERIEIVHVFLWLRLLAVASAARALGLPVVMTALEFGYFCRRFDFLKNGTDPCLTDTRGRACEICALACVSPRQRLASNLANLLPSRAEMALRTRVYRFLGRDLLNSLGSRTITDEIDEQRRSIDDDFAAIIVPSSIMFDFYKMQGASEQKLHRIPYAAEAPLQPGERRNRPSSPSSSLRVSFIGRFDPAKGLHVLIDAFGRVSGAEISLNIWGPENSGPADYVSKMRLRAQADPRMHWMGLLPHDRLGEAFGETDVLVVPSIWYENAPVIISEALTYGCPVICSDTPGMVDLIQNGVNGFTFSMGDVAELAQILTRLVRDPEVLRAIQQCVHPPPPANQIFDQIVSIYNHALMRR